jgi:hypothetical protein
MMVLDEPDRYAPLALRDSTQDTMAPMDLDEYRRSSHDIWERMAPGWDERRD